jgi:hypothetical protein
MGTKPMAFDIDSFLDINVPGHLNLVIIRLFDEN